MGERATVIVKCVGCSPPNVVAFGAGDVPEGGQPMCDRCYLPMVPVEARTTPPDSESES